MTGRKMIIVAAALAVALLCGVARAENVKATLAGIKGDVQARVSDGAEWKAAAEGATLEQGAEVKTGPGAEATLKMPGGHALKVSALSTVKIDALTAEAAGGTKTEFSLGGGRVMAKVGKLQTHESVFMIKTPVATAGVRGTTFDCALDTTGTQMSVNVIEGDVFVAIGDIESLVTEGFGTMITAGEAPPEPVEIPAPKLDELKTESETIEQSVEAEPTSEAAPAEKEETAAPAETEEEVSPIDAQTDQFIDTATENVAGDATILNDITESAEDLIRGCPPGGGCVDGTVDF